MALSVAVSVVGSFTPRNGLGITMKLLAFRVELTVTVENAARGVVAGLRLMLRLAPPLDVIVGEPTESI